MSKAMARVWARCIYRGTKSIDDVKEEYRELVRKEYRLLFGEEI